MDWWAELESAKDQDDLEKMIEVRLYDLRLRKGFTDDQIAFERRVIEATAARTRARLERAKQAKADLIARTKAAIEAGCPKDEAELAVGLRQSVNVKVLKADPWNGFWPPTNLLAFSRWVQEQTDLIPETYRAEALIEFTSDFDDRPEVTISFNRPENDDEVQQRVDNENARQARERGERRELYERLKEEFDMGDFS